MSKDYISLELGGKKRGLKFALGTLKYMRDATGGDDPLSENQDTFTFAHAIVYGGLMCNCIVKKEDPDFSKQDVEQWICGWSLIQVNEIIKAFNAAFTLSEEESKHTQE